MGSRVPGLGVWLERVRAEGLRLRGGVGIRPEAAPLLAVPPLCLVVLSCPFLVQEIPSGGALMVPGPSSAS